MRIVYIIFITLMTCEIGG